MEGLRETVQSQFAELIERYPSLMLRWENDIGIIEGDLLFKATFNGVEISDSYSIRIEIPATYPRELPITKETGGRIPGYFHKNGDDILCLEVQTKILMEFLISPKLLFYVEKFVIEYLYGFSYKKQFGVMPYGERPHGASGIMDFYKEELFKVSDPKYVLQLLRIVTSGHYRGHHQCPCNSGNRIRNCHLDEIKYLLSLGIQDSFRADLKTLDASMSRNS